LSGAISLGFLAFIAFVEVALFNLMQLAGHGAIFGGTQEYEELQANGKDTWLFCRYHTPGISLYRTLFAYSLYPFNSSCNVWSSHWVRTINTIEAKPAGINAHKEPNDSAMPMAWRIPPT
jgi:hypothetical protein